MIDKIHSINKMKLEQKLLKKRQLSAQSHECNLELENLQKNLLQSGVKMFGSISDFTILAIHKNAIKSEINKLQQKKIFLDKEMMKVDNELIESNKEVEKYKYILEVEKIKDRKKQQRYEDIVTNECIQARWNKNV